MKKTAYFVLPAAVLAFGIMFAGCPTENKEPYPQNITVGTVNGSWGNSAGGDELNGVVTLTFTSFTSGSSDVYEGSPAKIAAADLEWLSEKTIHFDPDTDGSRSISVDSVELQTASSSGTSVWMKINLKRTAEGSGPGKRAKITLDNPGDFRAKYDDIWGLDNLGVYF